MLNSELNSGNGQTPQVRRAFNQLRDNLQKYGSQFERLVGTKGGHDIYKVFWHPKARIWSFLTTIDNRYWCAYGVQDPSEFDRLNVTAEINPRLNRPDLRVGGFFALDALDRVHLCHNGNIGGGKQGIGKQRFWHEYRGQSVPMRYKEREVPVVDFGSVDDNRLVYRIAHFVHEVARIKEQNEANENVVDVDSNNNIYKQEFAGRRKPYTLSARIAAEANHGLVVDALYHELKRRRYEPRNDQKRDLYVVNSRGRPSHLFEVKTGIDTSSIYKAVGQLMINGRIHSNRTKLVMVLPEELRAQDEELLSRININVIYFRVRKSGQNIRFKGFEKI